MRRRQDSSVSMQMRRETDDVSVLPRRVAWHYLCLHAVSRRCEGRTLMRLANANSLKFYNNLNNINAIY